MGLSITGLGSGFDWKTMLSQLEQVEIQQKIDPLNAQKTKLQGQYTAWDSLGSKLSSLKTALGDLKDSEDFDLLKAALTSSNPSKAADSMLSVTVGSEAATGRYDIQINYLARAEKQQSASVATKTGDTGWIGTVNIEGNDVTLDGKSLEALRDEINELNGGENPTGVVASILQVSDSDYRLILTREETGAPDPGWFTDASGYFSILQAGRDASFTIDGIPMTRSSNTISDAIPGVTLNLLGEEGAIPATTITVELGRDTEAIEGKVGEFIEAYNGVIDYINQQMSYDESTNTASGVLYGNIVLKSIKSNLQNAMVNSGLSGLGITLGDENKLELDSTKLKEALETDFDNTVNGFNQMAALLDSQMERLTDSIDGTVTLQKNSAQGSMDRLDDKIESTQARVDMTIARLTAQYLSMDAALSQMEAQSSWLSAQLANL